MKNNSRTYLLGVLGSLVILCTLWCLHSKGQTTARDLYRQDLVKPVSFQQEIDHFSSDSRAMSPRDWGAVDNYSQSDAPATSFDRSQSIAATPPPLDPQTSSPILVDQNREPGFRSVEYGTVRQPKNFYDSQPMGIGSSRDSNANNSPIPGAGGPVPSYGNPYLQEKNDKKVPTPNKKSIPSSDGNSQPLKSRMENYQGPVNAQGIGSREPTISAAPAIAVPSIGHGQVYYGDPTHDFVDNSCNACQSNSDNRGCAACNPQLQINGNSESYRQFITDGRPLRKLRKRFGAFRPFRGKTRRCTADSCDCETQILVDPIPFQESSGCECANAPGMTFNPALGFRDEYLGDRFQESSAEEFAFEENEQYPSMQEILAQSIYFSEVDFMFLQPSFGGNTAFSAVASSNSIATPFNFDLEPAFRVMAGYESDYGPGFVGEYFQFDNNSDIASFTSDGLQTGEISVYQLGPNAWTRLFAQNAGETINALHSLEVHSTSVYAFKALKFKRASVNGRFGIQIATIQQKLDATLTNPAGAVVAELRNRFDINAFGPRFGIDYFRRVGHTPMQIMASATSSILFGDRDQQVTNSLTGESSTIGADEFITHIDIFFGLQMRRYRGEKRNTIVRIGFVNQAWIGGGTAIDPNDDFGMQGISMTLGMNR